MRNWFEAIEEDLEINFREIKKTTGMGISEKTLRKYKETGVTPRKNEQKRLMGMLLANHKAITQEQLTDYIDGNHAERPIDSIRRQHVSNIKGAIDECKSQGISLVSLSRHQPSNISQIPEWIYSVMIAGNGPKVLTEFLERIRIQIDEQEGNKKFAAVKSLHHAIASLIIVDTKCVEQAIESVSSMKGVSQADGPAIAALSIERVKGSNQKVEIEKSVDGVAQFRIPDNAIIPESFSIEDDSTDRVNLAIARKFEIIGKDKKKLEDSDIKKLNLVGSNNLNFLRPYFIYLNNEDKHSGENVSKYVQSLNKLDFPAGFHKFSSEHGQEINVLNEEGAAMWLLECYRQLFNMEEEKLNKIRELILSKDSADNPSLAKLQEEVTNTESPIDFLGLLERSSTILSNLTGTAADLPDAINNCSSLYEQATIILPYLQKLAT